MRDSKLEPVPSLALGTSPVTLKEMVAAYGAIANNGNYIEPMLVTQIEDRDHKVLAQFRPRAPESGLSTAAAQTLLDVMRGVIDHGTGVGVRRFGIRGHFAGKTGTTQDYTDGWFILMHPQLVGGAWVGFNDNRVTVRNDAWGQGAHNALYIVGDLFQQALKAKAIDAKAAFAAPRLPPPPPEPIPQGSDWLNGLVQQSPDSAMPMPAVVGPPSHPNPEFHWIPERPGEDGAPPTRIVRRGDPVPQIVIRRPNGTAPQQGIPRM